VNPVKIQRLLDKYPYAELRIEKGTESFIRITDDEVKVSTGTYKGLSVRVLKNGSWGFASTNGKGGIEDLLRKAERLATLDKGKIKLAKIKQRKKTIKKKIKRIESQDKLKILLDAKKEMKGKSIISKRIFSTDSHTTKEFYSTEGADIKLEENHNYVACTSIAKDKERIIRGVETAGIQSGFDKIDIHKIARISKEKAERLLRADLAPKGRFRVVLDPEMTGVFAHEALGHAAEADSVVDRESILSNKTGKKIGSQMITIVDDPTAGYFGAYAFDDEGVEAKKTVIMEKGILKNFMNSRETARDTKQTPNGHARASGYDEPPIVRMSNTFLLPGKDKKEDVFDLKKGIYIKGMRGGSVDIFSGGFMFKAEEAYEIKNGEIGNVLRDAAISGNILRTLNNVEAVGRDFDTSPGMCGKGGQDVPVSDGGPHIRIKNVMVG
jgi:TldD protein